MMNLVPYNSSLRNAYDDFDSFFDDFFRTGLNRVQGASFPMDVEKDDHQYIVTAEVPGLSKDNIDLDVEDGVLTISVHQEEEKSQGDEKTSKYFYHERRLQNATRKIRLDNIDESQITAKLDNGLLKINLPIIKEVSKKKSIDID